MKIHLLLSLLIAAWMNNPLSGQNTNPENTPVEGFIPNQHFCGTETPDAKWDDWFNEQVEFFKQGQNKAQLNYIIPVVVHVIHGGQAVGTAPNISQAQINSQITVLNQDYAGTGYNANTVPSVFANLVANTGVQFCMALKDPQGNSLPEPGIDRINFVSKGWPNPASRTSKTNFKTYIDDTIKPNTIWDPTKYMNVWVTDINGQIGLLGYATFPAGSTLTGLSGTGSVTKDGFWCWAKSFGTTGSVNAPYNKGRTATHEIGHWLGLRHISGDALCGNDYCNDTPPQNGGHDNCPNGLNWGVPPSGWQGTTGLCSGNTIGQEMFMNFMDYTDDAYKYMFTPDQTTRIQTAMANGTYRKLLGTHGLCISNFGINDNLLENNICLFPVPSNGNISVSFQLPFAMDLSCTLINALGQEVWQKTEKNIQHNTLELKLGTYEKGFYFFKISNGNTTTVKKIILD